jgi:hypothetical protein
MFMPTKGSIWCKWSNRQVVVRWMEMKSSCSLHRLGSVGENEFNEPIEDLNKRQTTVFTSYRQLLDMVDDCKENIW